MIKAYTDGSCINNPGPMGIGFVVYKEDQLIKKYARKLPNIGTNNIAELEAVNILLDFLVKYNFTNENIMIYTDSSYTIGVLTQEWNVKANKELVDNIKEKLTQFTSLTMHWIKGHNNNLDNIEVDKLAYNAASTS